jgi:uncharacterized membrane protein
MLEYIFEVVVACFLFLLFIALSYYGGKNPLKKSIGFGLLFAIVATGLPYFTDDLPSHIVIGVYWITMSLLFFSISRYLEKKSLKKSIKEGLIIGTFFAIILPIVGKSVEFLL